MHRAEAVLLLALAAELPAATVRFEVVREKSTIAVRTGKAGLLSAFGAGHRHGIVAGEFSARVCADPRTLDDASVSIRVPVSSLRIDSEEARRAAGLTESGPGAKDVATIQQKMVSSANLDAGGHPEVRFESTASQRTADGVTVRGPLTIRGRSNQVAVPLRIAAAGGDYRITGSFEVKLRDYGITPESVGGVVKVADEVTVMVDLVARARTEPCQ
jgi:polyisoprenoid-binding protein YceI